VNAGVLIFGAAAAVVIGAALVLNQSSGDDSMNHKVGDLGWVSADPHALAAAAGVSDNVYALASMMQSEGGGNSALRIATGWCARNKAERAGISVFRLLTRAGKNDKTSGSFVAHPSSGMYGPQNVGPRYASTRSPGSSAALEEAAGILAGTIDDPTDGCTQFDAPKVQDSLLGKLVSGYNATAEDVARDRTKSSDLVMLPGISSTRFWRPRV
jgi:hypothetical protein